MTPTVNWRWHLVRSSDLGLIADVTTNVHSKTLQPMLNQPGTATGWMHLLDEKVDLIEEHKTSILCYRNNKPIWSGPIYDVVEKSNATTDTLSFTAMGWFQLFNKRMVHTGLEWELMLAKSGASYIPVATESSLQLFYANKEFSAIANDLITRANIDVPTGVIMGSVPPMNSINFTIPQFHNVGELLTQLTSIESGFDFSIDPLTRKFNIYYNQIRGSINGLGEDRGAGVRFTYPGNCIGVERNSKGAKTQNRTEAVGKFGVGKAESLQSIQENGLFEQMDTLSDVVNTDILTAFAEIETLTLEQPFKIISFEPRAVNEIEGSSVPRPFEDYEIGDIVYAKVKKGKRLQIGLDNLQPVRIYGFTVEIDDNGVERIKNIQTVYTQ